MPKKIKVILESDTGQNLRFKDNYTGDEMTKFQFIKKIENGKYSNYHIRNINGVKTPVSNPDSTKNNNLN